jgi:hypothetical protein
MLDDLSAVDQYGARLSEAALQALQEGSDLLVDDISSTCRMTEIRFDFMPESVGDSEKMGVALKALEETNPTFIANDAAWRDRYEKRELPSSLRFPLRVLCLGSIRLLSIPAEVFAETQFDLQADHPELTVLIVSHSGGNIGYLPRPFAYRLRTYETASAYRWYGTEGAASEGEEERVRGLCSELIG